MERRQLENERLDKGQRKKKMNREVSDKEADQKEFVFALWMIGRLPTLPPPTMR